MSDDLELLQSLPGQPVAPEELNTVVLNIVVLGQLHVSPLDLNHPTRPFGLELRPIKNAFVVCVQHTVGGAAVPPRQSLRIGRTNNLGWLIERDEGDVTNPVPEVRGDTGSTPFGTPLGERLPVSAEDLLLFDSREHRTLYWCHGAERFSNLHRMLRKAPQQRPDGFEGTELFFREIKPEALDGLELVDKDLRARIGNYLLRGDKRGTIAEVRADRDVAIFDLTPPALRALYLAEFVQWYTVQAMKKGIEHWKVLARIKGIADITEHNAPDADLDVILKRLARPRTRERDILEHYRDFVWQCAMNGIERQGLDKALFIAARASPPELAKWRTRLRSLRDRSGG